MVAVVAVVAAVGTVAVRDCSTEFRLPVREEEEKGAGPILLLLKLAFSKHGRYCCMAHTHTHTHTYTHIHTHTHTHIYTHTHIHTHLLVFLK